MHDDTPPPMSRDQLLPLAIVVEGGLGLVALGACLLLGGSPSDWMQWSTAGMWWGVAGTVPMLAALMLCLRFPVGPIGDLVSVVDRHLAPLFRQCNLADFLLISLLAGVGEELLFRGLLQTELASWLAPRLGTWVGHAVALLFSSFVFGLLHSLTWLYAVLAGLIGLMLGGLMLATGDLLAPIIAHSLYDFVALVILTRRKPLP